MDFDDLQGQYPLFPDMSGEMPLYSVQPPAKPPMVMDDYEHVQPYYPTDLWSSWYDEPQIDTSMAPDVMSFNDPQIDMVMQDVMIFNDPVPDPTVETHGMRPLMPAPRALSACLEDLRHRERLRIQLAQMERERLASIHRRNRARRSLVRNIRLQRTNSNGSLTSSATSRRRSIPASCHDSVQVPAELNLKLVIQKELRNSDVSIHGRIVIPKRDAEAALPYLYDKDGINLCVKDVFTGKRWIMRYRFWPNHSSRMYLLDNTGGYIKKNNLASGDLIALFKDVNQRYYIGCKKMAKLLPPRRPLRMNKAKNEMQKIQRELEYLFDSDDGEELPSAASAIKKQLEEMLSGTNGDKGKSVAIAQTDVAGTSKGNADMSFEAGPMQNGPLCNDEPGASKGNADMSLEVGPVQNGPLGIDEPGASKGNADMSLEAGPMQNGPLCIDGPIINLDDFSAELFEEFHISDNFLDEFLWE